MKLFLHCVFSLLLVHIPIAKADDQPKVLKVAPEQFYKLALRTDANVQRVLLAESEVEEIEENEHAVREYMDLKEANERRKSSDGETSSGIHFNPGGGGGGGGREFALIVFAIVGLVMVAMWVPYFPIFAYEAYTGVEKYNYLQLFSFQGTFLETRSTRNSEPDAPVDESREGYLFGSRYGLYLKRKNNNSRKDLGISGELGIYQFKDVNKVTGQKRLFSGGYWMIGPSLLFGGSLISRGSGSLFGKLDLLGGSSINSDLGLVTRADISLNFSGKSNFLIGLGVGGMYMDVNSNRGIISRTNDLSLIGSFNLGYVY